MKRLCITYHMFRPKETAENCITTYFSDEVAEDLLNLQEDSRYVTTSGRESISDWLQLLAKLQGYDRGYFVLAQSAEKRNE